MAISRQAIRPTKRERTAQHIERLKKIIRSSYPEAEFELGPVPESKWPALWVYADVDDSYDLYDLVRDESERFFQDEAMYVYVINLGPTRNGA